MSKLVKFLLGFFRTKTTVPAIGTDRIMPGPVGRAWPDWSDI